MQHLTALGRGTQRSHPATSHPVGSHLCSLVLVRLNLLKLLLQLAPLPLGCLQRGHQPLLLRRQGVAFGRHGIALCRQLLGSCLLLG